jgi:hypothetical protein
MTWLGADLESIIRCRHWSNPVEGTEDSKFVLEILCVKKQQKFKFVFEKISHFDPFQPMYDSLSAKIASVNRKISGTNVLPRDELAITVSSHHIFCFNNGVIESFIQSSGSHLSPLRKTLSLSDDSFTCDVQSTCMSLISQVMESITKSGEIFAFSPKQSSDSSTALMNHVEALCQVVSSLQESNRVSAIKIKESEQSVSILKQHIHELSRKHEPSQHQRTLDIKSQSLLELKNQHDLMAASVISYKIQIQKLEDMQKQNVRNDT